MRKKDIHARCWIDTDGVKYFVQGSRTDEAWSMKRVVIIIAFVLLSASSFAQQKDRIRIAAASSLKFALDSIVRAFEARQPGRVDLSYGSSGKLFEQISNGAPFDIFFSADMDYPSLLRKRNMAASEPYIYGTGRLVVWSKKIDVSNKGIKSLLDPGVKKISIANPMHAPYGKRAEEALTHYAILDDVKSRLVYGQNISQAAQFVTSGAADVGIIALSLALSPNMKREKGAYFIIPENSHLPLELGVVTTRRGEKNDFAKTFMDFVKGEQAVAILLHFGIRRP